MKNNITSDRNRVDWVDIFKGICIIAMVLGHAGAPFTTYIYMFHIPAFIFISGYTFNGDQYSVFSYVKKKIKTLIIPFFSVNIIFIIIVGITQHIGIYNYFFERETGSFREQIFLLFQYLGTPEWGGATWFFPVLFIVEIFYMCFYRISKFLHKEFWAMGLGIICSFLGWAIVKQQIKIPFQMSNYLIDLGLLGLLFFVMGRATRVFEVFSKKIEPFTMIVFALIICIFFGGFYFKGLIPMNWPTRQFDSLPVHIITCLCSFYLCYKVSCCLGKNWLSEGLKYIGKKTFCILVYHFAGFKVAYFILILLSIRPVEEMSHLVPMYSAPPIWLFVSIISIGVCLVLSKISEKFAIGNYIINGK